MFSIKIIYLLFLYIITINAQNMLDDRCTIKSTGENGTCLDLGDCDFRTDFLKNGKLPQICGFMGTKPIVCCSSRLKRKIGDISEQKCSEYQLNVFDSSKNPEFSLTNKSALLYVSKCAIDNDILSPKYNRARIKEFPYMALLGFNGKTETIWHCSGALISNEYVLTSAHCTRHKNYGSVKYIRLGELIISETNESESKDFTVSRIILHPKFNNRSRYNDIALLSLNETVKFTPYIRPACLHMNHAINSNRLLTTGWKENRSSTNCRLDTTMKKSVQLPLSVAECSFFGRNNNKLRKYLSEGILESQLCAGLIFYRKNFCEDDIGPLVILDPEKYCMFKVVGITAFGNECGLTGTPGVFTKVSSYIQWIENIVWP